MMRSLEKVETSSGFLFIMLRIHDLGVCSLQSYAIDGFLYRQEIMSDARNGMMALQNKYHRTTFNNQHIRKHLVFDPRSNDIYLVEPSYPF